MAVSLEVKGVSLDIPVFDVSRSFRTSLLNLCVGGQITQNDERKNMVSIRALENINFSLKGGDKLGLIGHNGSGKTSLLRLLARVYKPLIGSVRLTGKVTPLFNAALGIDLDDTGLENIFTIGMYLGMSKQEVERKKDGIIAFSGLGDFIKLPVKTYSAGMQVRLSFSIATALDTQILLMDEGISMGDDQFAASAEARLEEFYGKIDILVVASHSDDLIRRLCNKAMLLEHGRIVAYGNVEDVIEQYHGKKRINIAGHAN